MLTKHWAKLFVMASFVLMVIILSCGEDSLNPVDSNLNGTLKVTHISPEEAPVIGDNDFGFDFAWSKAETLFVVVEGPQSQLQVVRLLGLTDGEYFYLMAVWNDPTKDVKPDHVLWIDKGGVHARTGGQDFFYAIFADGSNGDVGADCYRMCHSSVVDIIEDDTTFVDSMRNTGPGMVDSWVWMSGQTDPVGSKWGVPGTLVDLHFPPGGLTTWDATVNRTPPIWNFNADVQDSTVPRWMHPDSNFYFGDFLFDSEKEPFTHMVTYPDSIFDTIWGQDSVIVRIDTTVNIELGFQKGAEVPGYVLADSVVYYEDDSRFEVVAKGTYSAVDRQWYLEMKRKLDTGFDDDIPFVLGERTQCTIGVTNSPVANRSTPHYGSKSFYIQF
jgi:hypothetical protein